jgi:Tfp pilus assembly protein PilV
MHRRGLIDAFRIRSKRGGFTLLEVALAVLVLGTALVALTRMLVLGRLCADADAQRVVALSILREQAERARVRGYNSLESQAAAAVDGQPGYSRSLEVASAGVGLRLVTITVFWDSPTGRPVSEAVQCLVGDAVLPTQTREAP